MSTSALRRLFHILKLLTYDNQSIFLRDFLKITSSNLTITMQHISVVFLEPHSSVSFAAEILQPIIFIQYILLIVVYVHFFWLDIIEIALKYSLVKANEGEFTNMSFYATCRIKTLLKEIIIVASKVHMHSCVSFSASNCLSH